MKRKAILPILLLAALTGCQNEQDKFTINGHIQDAKDSTIVLEHLDLNGRPHAIDSVKLGNGGAFELQGERPQNPEFYRLRLGQQMINLSVDSTETITVEAKLKNMATEYSVTGSGNSDTIRLLSIMMVDLNQRLEQISRNRDLTLRERDERIRQEIADYKKRIKLDFIQNRYGAASSYYALFQTSGGLLVFDPLTDASDVTWISAIANAWQENWPDAPRTRNLVSIALRGRKNTRRRVLEVNMDDERVHETGIIDMQFPDINGQERRLSELKGKVVLLDFTLYGMKGSQERIMALRNLYNQYHSQGFEIYQVALDGDEHFWKTMCRQLPWVCVWNPNGQTNDILTIYNVQVLPTWFLIDRENTLVGRQELVKDLESEIKKLL